MSDINKNQRAFTIIELMIASMVFSVILLLVTTGVIRIGNSYYSGALRSRTQDTARNIIDEISRGIQFSGVNIRNTENLPSSPAYSLAINGSIYGFCVNNVSYAYIMDKKLTKNTSPGPDEVQYGLLSYDNNCSLSSDPADITNTATVAGLIAKKELLGLGMRVTDLEVRSTGSNNMYEITVGIASGADDLFNETGTAINKTCKSGAGSQYCAVSKLTTTVQKRLQ